MSVPKKLIELIEKDNAAGMAKFLSARKRPFFHRTLLGLFGNASDAVIGEIVKAMQTQTDAIQA